MADEDPGSPPPGPTRLPFIIGGVLIVLFVAIGLAKTEKKTEPVKTEGSRAVVLPTGPEARTVIVPPCSPPVVVTKENALSQISVPGVVALRVPGKTPPRTIVIPRCQARQAPMPGAANIPSAAFVLEPGATVSDAEQVKNPWAQEIRTQVTIPAGSPVTTVIAAPCLEEEKAEKTTVLSPEEGKGTIAIAPRC